MTFQDKYLYLSKRVNTKKGYFSAILSLLKDEDIISSNQYEFLYELYETDAKSPSLCVTSYNNTDFGNKTILALNLLYKIVYEYDNRR